MTGIANIALLSEETGRIFGLDAQLLFDILIQGLAVFLLFIFLTYQPGAQGARGQTEQD